MARTRKTTTVTGTTKEAGERWRLEQRIDLLAEASAEVMAKNIPATIGGRD